MWKLGHEWQPSLSFQSGIDPHEQSTLAPNQSEGFYPVYIFPQAGRAGTGIAILPCLPNVRLPAVPDHIFAQSLSHSVNGSVSVMVQLHNGLHLQSMWQD